MSSTFVQRIGLSPAATPAIAGRRAVLLQGPVGPFFGRLQDSLDAAGWDTARILFNSGDRLFHGQGRELSFSGRMAHWPSWFAGFLKNFAPDVVLLFGDQRPIHREATRVAARLGVPVICFEEGYLRPDYVTMELGGNNAASSLREWRHDPAKVVTNPAPQPMPGNGFRAVAWNAWAYFSLLHFAALRYPYYEHHRQRGVVRESLMWVRNAWRKWRRTRANLSKIHWVVEHLDQRYFVVALQVHDDLQLRRHGAGWTVESLIEATIGSFARHAHGAHHLVLKGHPLDRGHSASLELTRKIASLYGVESRVHYVDDGSLGLLTRHARGMVTVNSTSALVAFGHNKPVFAAGDSFYQELTVNGADRSEEALARFWRLTPQLDPKIWPAFRAHMVAASQLNGSFYIESELDGTCRRAIARLEALLESARLRASEPANEDGRQIAEASADLANLVSNN